MVNVEEFGVLEFVGTKDASIGWISLRVPLHGGGVEYVGQIEVFLPWDVGQISFGLVHSFGQTQLGEMFLQESKPLH